MPILPISVTGREKYQSMCSVLAVLAYPNIPRSRTDFERALTFHTARETARRYPTWGEETTIPSAVLLSPQPVDRAVKKGLMIINDERISAATAGDPFLLMGLGKKPTLDGKRFSTGAAFQKIADQLGHLRKGSTSSISHSTIDVYWKNSKPVLHLAIAYRALVDRVYGISSPRSLNISSLLSVENGAAELIELSMEIRNILLSLRGPASGPTAIPQFQKFGMIELVAG